MLELFEESLLSWAGAAALVLLSVLVGYLLYRLLVFLVERFAKPASVPRIFFDASVHALGLLICLLFMNSVLHTIPETLPFLNWVQQITTVLLILTVTWVAVACTSAIGDVIVLLNPALEDKWLKARKLETQTRFLVRGLNIIIILVGISVALMTFESVNQIGASLLASAGIGSVILGFAARPVLSNLLAGMQIALTQPFRIDDVLHVQGEWCWVEEVTATYVVLRVWDLRRLVIPLQWFIENPFQNWSRKSTDLLGSTMIWADYGIPLDPLREEFNRLLESSTDWDGGTATVQLVEAGEKAVQIRFLMSARNSTRLWDLRCHIREKMIDFIQQYYPQHLPRHRTDLGPQSAGDDLDALGPQESP